MKRVDEKRGGKSARLHKNTQERIPSAQNPKASIKRYALRGLWMMLNGAVWPCQGQSEKRAPDAIRGSKRSRAHSRLLAELFADKLIEHSL